MVYRYLAVPDRDAIFAEYGIRDAQKLFDIELTNDIRDQVEAGMKCIRTDNHKYILDSNGKNNYTNFRVRKR
jgi:hypothetical protein